MDVLKIKKSDRIQLDALLHKVAKYNGSQNIDMFLVSENSVAVKTAADNPEIKGLYTQLIEILDPLSTNSTKNMDHHNKPITLSRGYSFENGCRIEVNYTAETDTLIVYLFSPKSVNINSYGISDQSGVDFVSDIAQDITTLPTDEFVAKYDEFDRHEQMTNPKKPVERSPEYEHLMKQFRNIEQNPNSTEYETEMAYERLM